MPVALTGTERVVPPQVLDTLSDSNSSTTANDLDLIFLKGIIDSPVEPESLEKTRLVAVRDNNVELVEEILRELSPFTHQSNTAAELTRILIDPHFQSLLETHDSVASQDSELKRTVDESPRIQTAYGHYFDLTIVNDNLDESYRNLKAALEKVSATQQWVPVTWVF